MPKKGAWTVSRFKGGLENKEGVVYLRVVDTLMTTIIFFQIYGLQITENVFASQKDKSRQFYSCFPGNFPPKFSSLPSQQREITDFLKAVLLFENLFPLQQDGGGEETMHPHLKSNLS